MSQTADDFDLQIPDNDELIALFRQAAERDETLSRTRAAIQTGRYVDPDGHEKLLGDIKLSEDQLGLLVWLSKQCRTPLSVEVGFGMGSSAATILCSRREASGHDRYYSDTGHDFRHVVFDPVNTDGGVVSAYLQKVFPQEFLLRHLYSEFGLVQLIQEHGFGTTDLLFIDGNHHFENVMTDFVLANHLCSLGGYIVFDDACRPPIESVVNYVKSNRPDFAVSETVSDTVVLRKISADTREWCAYKPFAPCDRSDWTARQTLAPPAPGAPELQLRQLESPLTLSAES